MTSLRSSVIKADTEKLFNSLSIPMAILDRKGLLTSLNRAWLESAVRARFLGGTCRAGDDYLKKCAQPKRPSPNTASDVARGLRQVLRRSSGQFETEYRSTEGKTEEWFRLLAVPFGVDGAIVMHIPITEYKRAEMLQHEFSHLGQKLSSAATTKKAAWTIVEVSQKLIGWDAFVLDLYSPESGTVRPVLTLDTVDGKIVEVRSVNPQYNKPTERTRRAIEEGGFLILRERTTPKPKDLVPFGNTRRLSASIIFVPIRNRTRVTGILSIQSYTYNAYTQADLKILQALADHCGGALERIWAEEERERAQAQLKKSHEHLRALAGRLQSVKEEECSRISREIHDELGQALTGMKFDLSWLEKKLTQPGDPKSLTALQSKVKSMVRFANQTLESVRRISRELRPRVLDDLGLAAAIEWQAQEFEKRMGIHCELLEIENSLKIPAPVATAVFRIFQEILTNVARHAEATRVTISLQKQGDHLLLRVSDNGRGISKKQLAANRSLGLFNMRERADFFGGEVNIRGEKNKGTRVTVHIPFRHLKKS